MTMYAVDFKKFAGTPKLFLDFINCREPACRFFKHNFRSPGSYKAVAEQIDGTSYDRKMLASVISGGASSIGLSQATLKNIEKLERPDSLCVMAGQQVGMLLGPMYTILKALTAYKLAQRLEIELERPVVPCFWLASDDHDFDEIKTVNLLDRDGNCKSITYEPQMLRVGAPMSDVILNDDIQQFSLDIETNLIPTEFRESVVAIVRAAYKSGRSVSQAFAILFDTFLSDFGIVPVDPNYPGMKKLFEPVFRREIEHHEAVYEIFEKHSKKIIDSGYHRQVHKAADSLNLFYSNGARRNILVSGDNYRLDGHDDSYSRNDMLKLLSESTDKFSPNVTLRPIAQSFAIPTISQIVGPSEAAYFAQIGPLFDYHGVPFPVIRPRIFATILEPHIKKMMQKFSVDFAGLSNDKEFEAGRIIRENFPDETQSQAENLQIQIERLLAEVAEPLKTNDLESYQAMDHTRRRILHELNHLSKKLFMAHKKKHEDARERVHKIAKFVLPNGNFQERVISPVYFANKFGTDIFRRIEGNFEIESIAHQLVEIEA